MVDYPQDMLKPYRTTAPMHLKQQRKAGAMHYAISFYCNQPDIYTLTPDGRPLETHLRLRTICRHVLRLYGIHPMY